MPNYITEGTGMRILLAAGGVPDGTNIPQARYMTERTGKKIAAALESGAAAAVTVIEPEATELELEPCPKTYKWGEVAELSVTVTADSQYHFMFTCPSDAATVLTITGETVRCGDTLETGKTYEVDIWAGITRICEVDGEAVTP